MHNLSSRAADYFRRTDKLLWVIMLLISVYSLLLLTTVPKPSGGRSWFSVQLIAVICGYIGAILLTMMDYRTVANYWYLVGGFCVFLILLTLFKGITITGADGVAARAWLKLPGGLTFQASELVKIGFLLTFGKHLDLLQEQGELLRPVQILLLCVHALIPIGLVYLQKDTGTAIIFFFMFLFMAFAAGIPMRYFAALGGVIAVMVPFAWNFLLEDYQKNRLLIFRHPEKDPQGYGLQQLAGKISISSGQLTGRGLFTSPRVNSSVVPVQQSDLIFSVAGEQLGFVGCVGIIVLLIALMLLCVRNARRSTDLLGSSICIGFFAMIFSQTAFNLGMCLDLMPVMGVTLPFFSSGGSSVMCLYFGFGLVQSVVIHREDGRNSRRLFLD